MLSKDNLLNNFIEEFNAVKAKILELKEKYEKEDFIKQPGKKEWSAGECLEHLYRANSEYIENTLESMKVAGTSTAENKNYRPRFIVVNFIKMMKPDSFLKLKAPKIFKKKYHGDLHDTIERYMKTLDEFIDLADKSRKYDLKIKVVSPVTRLVKFQLAEMFMLMIQHQKRHLAQAERALKKVTRD